MASCSQGGQGVGDVVLAGQLPLDCSLDHAFEQHLEVRAIGAQQARLPLAALACGLHRRPATHADDTLQGLFCGGVDDQAFARDGSHQMVELPLDGRQIWEDIRMIELKIIEDRRTGW